MKKSLFYAFALAIVMLLGSSQAKADVISTLDYTLNLNTFVASDWQVARIIGTGDPGYVNPTKNGSYYSNAATATQWGDFAVNWNTVAWSEAKPGARGTWETKDEQGNVLVSRDDWVAVTSDNESKVTNGFFAFKYTLTAADLDEKSVAGTLNLSFGADDYLAAIYANGTELYSRGFSNTDTVGDDSNKNGQWHSLNSLIFEDVALIDGQLELVFVIHNTNAAGSDIKDGEAAINPMGLYLDGTITTDIEMIPPREDGDVLTPEPATLLIFSLAGAAGLPFARRLRKRG